MFNGRQVASVTPVIVVQLSSLADAEVRALLGDWGLGRWGSVVEVEEFEPPSGAFLKARIEGQVCGCVGLRHWSTDEAEIKRLYVADEARGRGVGRDLVAGAADRARVLGYSSVVLETDGSNLAALGLFRSQGFVLIPDYNKNRFARYWFRKDLT